MPRKKSTSKKRKARSKRKSRRSKKQSLSITIIVVLAKALWYILKLPFRLVKWLIKKHKERKQQRAEEETSTAGKKQSKKSKRDIKKHRKEISELVTYEKPVELETIQGDYKRFEYKLFNNKSTIGIILGARGKGKSALGMRILENAYKETKRPCYCIGFSEENLPLWIKNVESIDQIKNGSIVLIDEGGILFSSRNSMTEANKVLSDALLVARHNDLSIMFISQNSSNLEINTLRQADFLLLKPSSLLQKDFERKKIKDIYDEAKEGFKKHERDRGLTYIYSNEFQGFVSNTLPSFWNTELSKSFRK